MAFTIPDKGEGLSDIQAIFFQEDLEVLVAAAEGRDCVLSGCAVTPNTLLVLNVAVGQVVSSNKFFNVTAGTVNIVSADATNPRIDLVVADAAGAKQVRAGTAAVAPKPPARTANDVVLAQVYVPALDATIDAAQIKDRRVIRDARICIALAADQSNSTTTPTEVAGLSLTLPAGTYTFQYYIDYQAAAATTGVKFDVNFTGTVTRIVWNQSWVDVSATASTAVPDQDAIIATGQVIGAFASRAKGTAGRGVTLSVDTINADMLMIIEGVMTVSTGGSLALWHGSEVAAASTVKAGSVLLVDRGG